MCKNKAWDTCVCPAVYAGEVMLDGTRHCSTCETNPPTGKEAISATKALKWVLTVVSLLMAGSCVAFTTFGTRLFAVPFGMMFCIVAACAWVVEYNGFYGGYVTFTDEKERSHLHKVNAGESTLCWPGLYDIPDGGKVFRIWPGSRREAEIYTWRAGEQKWDLWGETPTTGWFALVHVTRRTMDYRFVCRSPLLPLEFLTEIKDGWDGILDYPQVSKLRRRANEHFRCPVSRVRSASS